jgi:bifunctional non-homologous end joining protein LigD
MPLDVYRRKRDFARTPEPPGDLRPRQRSGARIFCVHKHLATTLHYDLRLEHRGVLLSWAVPKGPSIDPAARRLAMRVEDHPLDYATFEGVIPEGYGAGIVMLWDHGTWEPEHADVDAALARGALKFRLHGYKLNGSWALVRTGGRPDHGATRGREDWLLIKHRDAWAGPLDITAFAPRSVKSDGDLDDILAADLPPAWLVRRPVRGGAAGHLLGDLIDRAVGKIAARHRATPGRRARAARPAARRSSSRRHRG